MQHEDIISVARQVAVGGNASALGPPAMGFMMIAGVSLQNMVLGPVIYLLLATVLIWVACSVQWRH